MFLLNTVCANILIIIKNTIFANNIFVMKLSTLGSATSKVGNSIDALAKTDDMLAIIGAIMLLGVIFSAYGAVWQGLLARKQYKEQCTPTTSGSSDHMKTIVFLFIGVAIGGIVIAFIFNRQSKA